MSSLFRFLGGQARNRRNLTIYFAIVTQSFRLVRRVMTTRQRTLLRFQVKPGEVYEVRGVRRGQ